MANTLDNPTVTVLYRKTAGMSMKVLRKDFTTHELAVKWMDFHCDNDTIEIVEFRAYTN